MIDSTHSRSNAVKPAFNYCTIKNKNVVRKKSF